MKKTRAFLKWAGGKYGLIEDIQQQLPEGDILIEPFVGAASVFLNTNYSSYVLSDINPDLINMYKLLQTQPQSFIDDAKKLFIPATNQSEYYYSIRTQFNASSDPYQRSLMFLYMNRHGYNGLCRYNRSGGFNVPFGSYKRPYFPEHELEFFAEKAQYAEFRCCSYVDTFAAVKAGDIVYCDPPYAPLSPTASFTNYASKGFNRCDQERLGELALQAQQRGASVLISNHDLPLTRDIYQHSVLSQLSVRRTISRKGHQRMKVAELLAYYQAN
ncbi:Dam family site-specific DNA-(adenine-N6)-methyltransferase [Agarivorans sp. MS3-6]|uniref:Dam family site-specific DNA-(adenine-N6)-methyltransferase n=1 Tax=Agarivorans sp. TSD2052 TaxID=2937286 RepID=UPI00200ECDF3|nr:Dam family site-specific DNA-(adenine-N6)-methyltransferase [Agarivorans sp. TSD2052]UPW19157.1 Dam family site-specific DNA-(adenine-N6)-methyltransferase [Agarivorans sp. TSD2052]